MSIDLILKPSCSGCGSAVELYGSTCKYLTLCVTKCYECGSPITQLIREEFKNKPWLLEDETGQFQYHGHFEGSQSATYYLLMLQGKEFVPIPAGSWYNFNKVAQYKQLTLEEAEVKMKNRRKTVDGYQRWMMKATNNGAATFCEVEKSDDRESTGGGGSGREKATGEDDEANVLDRGKEDEEEVAGENSSAFLIFDVAEKCDDWEHDEIFTDDDEAVGNDHEEWEDLVPEIPAPLEIKQLVLGVSEEW
ncbi:hypothetical protein BUALT_Bualt05G0132900 [Buddleja alternifolia]|uniref:Transcription initiation factor IIF subunit alpha n=1 Tax=Buddleja alternifolia TaxID=168488 RepID=A0AAV6XKV3_9LAMI|nr:hypothetical protein BUALT_Bualt05G0132900 [Buddleja alternifolia]